MLHVICRVVLPANVVLDAVEKGEPVHAAHLNVGSEKSCACTAVQHTPELWVLIGSRSASRAAITQLWGSCSGIQLRLVVTVGMHRKQMLNEQQAKAE